MLKTSVIATYSNLVGQGTEMNREIWKVALAEPLSPQTVHVNFARLHIPSTSLKNESLAKWLDKNHTESQIMVLGVRRPDTSARACHDQYAVTSTHPSTCLQISQVWMTCTLKYFSVYGISQVHAQIHGVILQVGGSDPNPMRRYVRSSLNTHA